MATKPTNVDSYLAALPDDARETLEEMQRRIKAVAPDATETFSYGMPGYKYKGRPLAYLGAAKEHLGLYGIVTDAHREKLARYEISKGTVRFSIGKPLPKSVVKLLVGSRVAEIDAAEAAKKRKK